MVKRVYHKFEDYIRYCNFKYFLLFLEDYITYQQSLEIENNIQSQNIPIFVICVLLDTLVIRDVDLHHTFLI